MSQRELATRFRQLHTSGADRILVLPNVWDAMSARAVQDAGAAAIATTSAGIAWARGYADGQRISRDEMLDVVAVIARAVHLPVTADVEAGYGAGRPEDIAETVRGVIAAGAVGVNLEDAPGRDGARLLEAEAHAERIAAGREAARATGVDLYINARTDTWLGKFGDDDAARFDETVRRARLYLDAGASGIFVPLAPAGVIGQLAKAIDAPLNVIAGSGWPTIPELQALGVARVSLGPCLTRTAIAHVRRVATEVLMSGTYETMREQVTSAEVNGWFAGR